MRMATAFFTLYVNSVYCDHLLLRRLGIKIVSLFCFRGATAPSGPESPHYRSFMIILGHNTAGRTRLDEWSARRRDLYLTTNNTRNTDIHDAGGIRTRNPSKREAADLRTRGEIMSRDLQKYISSFSSCSEYWILSIKVQIVKFLTILAPPDPCYSHQNILW